MHGTNLVDIRHSGHGILVQRLGGRDGHLLQVLAAWERRCCAGLRYGHDTRVTFLAGIKKERESAD